MVDVVGFCGRTVALKIVSNYPVCPVNIEFLTPSRCFARAPEPLHGADRLMYHLPRAKMVSASRPASIARH
jgi:hypothetical protein